MDITTQQLYDEVTDTSYEYVLVKDDNPDAWLYIDYDLDFDYNDITIQEYYTVIRDVYIKAEG